MTHMYRKATSQRLLYTLFLAQSLFSASQIAIFTLVAIVAVRLSGSESAAGSPSSAQIFAHALSALPFAMMMGRFGRRLGLTLGYAVGALGGVTGFIAIMQGSFPLLLIGAILVGMARASSDQGRYAAGEMFPEGERARMIGRLVFAGTIGAVAGPGLVAPSRRWMEGLGLPPDSGPWAATVLLSGLALLLVFFFLRPDPTRVAQTFADTREVKRYNEHAQPSRPLSALLMLPQVQLAVMAVLISQTVMVVLMVVTPLHMHHHHHNTETISLVISMHTLGMYGLSPLTGYLIDRFGRIPMLLFGALTLVTASLLAPLSTNQYILAVALFLLGLGWNFGYVAGTSLLVAGLQGEERARVQGMNDSLVFLAAGFGSLVAGSLFASGGYVAISIAGLVLALMLISMILWFSRPQPSVEAV